MQLRRGNNAIEFALILPVLLTLIFGILGLFTEKDIINATLASYNMTVTQFLSVTSQRRLSHIGSLITLLAVLIPALAFLFVKTDKQETNTDLAEPNSSIRQPLSFVFLLTILGTFLTRSGVLNSVHAFSESAIGPWLLSFFAIIVVVSVGLIGWRGDRLHSPGSIDSALSREGAFLANNVLFAVFAFVVLLGTVFPLVVEALQSRTIVVGEPFFVQLVIPIGIAMLTLMAIAPVLPWRKASGELLSQRLFWPAWCGIGALALSVFVGATGFAPLLAFGLGGFATGSALRQVVLATRRQGWRGLVGRANGGMVVHVGVIMISVALAASNSFTHSQELSLVVGKPATFSGHTFELIDVVQITTDRDISVKALVSVDGGKPYAPAITKFTKIGMNVGTPSVRTGFGSDIYLTLEPPVRQDSNEARIKVFIKPLILWLWIGSGLMAVGTVLAAFPGKRRKPTDPTSALIDSHEVSR